MVVVYLSPNPFGLNIPSQQKKMKTAMEKFISGLRSIFHISVWNNVKKSSQEEIELQDLSMPIIEQIETRRYWVRIAGS